MDPNIRMIEPNMAMFLKNHELKFYNLIYNRANETKTGYENFLLPRYNDATIPLTAFPTTIELQTPVNSLDYDGNYFWSVQPLNDTPAYPGFIIRRWEISPTLFGAQCTQFRCLPGFSTATSLSMEYYNIPIRDGMGTDRNYIIIDGQYRYAVDRMRVGQTLQIGPNIHGDIFTTSIASIIPYTSYPNPIPLWYHIQFGEHDFPPTSHTAGENCFIETCLFIFTTGGELYEINPTNLSTINKITSDSYRNVTACAFSIINNISSINLGNKTPSLFFVSEFGVYCLRVADLTLRIASQSLVLNSYPDGNTFIPIYEMRIRNDNPDSLTNHPQFYFLQNQYKETQSSSVSSWTSYNYLTSPIEAQASFLILNTDQDIIAPNSIVNCQCQALDNYRFPISNIPIVWTSSPGGAGVFLRHDNSTNVSGIAYATFSGATTIPFPTYITATTSAF